MKKVIALCLSLILLLSCGIVAVNAESSGDDSFLPAALVVTLTRLGHPQNITMPLNGFDTETPYLMNPGDPLAMYYVQFKDEVSDETVDEAVDALKSNPVFIKEVTPYYSGMELPVDLLREFPFNPPKSSVQPITDSGFSLPDGTLDPASASMIAETIAEAANKRYFDPRHTITAEDISVFDFYQFQDSPAFAVYFYVKELGYYDVMIEEKIGDWVLVSSHPEPYLFVNNKLYGFKEAYDAGMMTDDMLEELAASDFRGGCRYPILTPYDDSYVLPEPTIQDHDAYLNGELYVSVQTEMKDDIPLIAKTRLTVMNLLKDFETESVSIMFSYDTEAIFKVTLAEKATTALWDAIAVLEQDPAANFAIPNHGEYSYGIPDDFAPGVVLVCGSGFEELLSDFDVVSVDALTSSFPQTIYKVTFAEQNTDVVWRALEILENAPSILFADPDYYQHVDNASPDDPEPNPTEALWQTGADPTPEDIVFAVNNRYSDIRSDVSADAITVRNSYRFKCMPAYIVDYRIEGCNCYADAVWEEYTLGDYLLYSSCAYEPKLWIDNKLFELSAAYRANILSDEMLQELVEANYQGGINEIKCRLVTRFIKGDADGDGEVSIIDATVIQRHEANIANGAFYKPLADVDGDSEVNIIDATLIQRSEAGMYTIT